MAEQRRQPDPFTTAEVMFGAARPAFGRARRGLDPGEVLPYLDMLERERSDLGASLVLAQARVRELTTQVERYRAIEEELARTLDDARQRAVQLVAEAEARAVEVVGDAHEKADAVLAAGRATLAEEAQQLDGLRMAVAAEAAALAALEDSSHISRAAAALVQLVDGPGGLGPFSRAAGTLLEFARLLQRTSQLEDPPLPVIDLRHEDAPAAATAAVPEGEPSAEPLPSAVAPSSAVHAGDERLNGREDLPGPAEVRPLPAVVS